MQLIKEILTKKAKNLETPNLQNCIVSVLFCSLAVLQSKHDEGIMFLKTRNLFLQIALRVSDTISAYELTEDHVIIGLEDYMVVI